MNSVLIKVCEIQNFKIMRRQCGEYMERNIFMTLWYRKIS